ncbi:MAG TPA: hypothetical protein VGT44_23605 [Ktedonobacteraceae bacterium]|nr:hypothetical protein [Ktedonobacteraceae bacterium]
MLRPHSRLTSLAVTGCLLVLLVACGPFGPADTGPTPTASTVGATATPTRGRAASTPTTVPMPATQTACPSPARAAVFAPLVLGSHQTIVYLFNQAGASGSAEIKRYDASTGKKVIILNETSQFPWSNVSRDGSRYVLKITSNNGPTQTTQSLLIGSLGGASPSTFATVSSTVGSVAIVGWTTM